MKYILNHLSIERPISVLVNDGTSKLHDSLMSCLGHGHGLSFKTVMESPQISQCESLPSTKQILLAASQHDILRLKQLLKGNSTAPANVQDPVTGYTPLHATIAACGCGRTSPHAERDGSTRWPDDSVTAGSKNQLEAAAETARLLLQNGAIWNEVDMNLETPGCLARKFRLWELYEIMVDAGESSWKRRF